MPLPLWHGVDLARLLLLDALPQRPLARLLRRLLRHHLALPQRDLRARRVARRNLKWCSLVRELSLIVPYVELTNLERRDEASFVT